MTKPRRAMTKHVHLVVTLTENARTPGGHVGREFCKPFLVHVDVPVESGR